MDKKRLEIIKEVFDVKCENTGECVKELSDILLNEIIFKDAQTEEEKLDKLIYIISEYIILKTLNVCPVESESEEV